ncbi:MAG: hypothetical protein CO132_04305 [Candidatus Kerfeldbacteria bacterium CG_4_9_14_3_um_filter_45_8]|nr:MAG: hypothetical protein CO132_04305 [Candidatus Kerfeldbacteria bacterium CG_4_9_14_3_um_filter_45_8]
MGKHPLLTTPPRSVISLFLVAGLLLAGEFAIKGRSASADSPEVESFKVPWGAVGKEQASARLPLLAETYASMHPDSQPTPWLMGETTSPSDYAEVRSRIQAMNGLVERYQHASADTEEIFYLHPGFIPLVLTERNQLTELRLAPEPAWGAQELALVNHQHTVHCGRAHPLAEYNSGVDVIMLQAVEVPDAWLAALLYEQLGASVIQQVSHYSQSNHSPIPDDVYLTLVREAVLVAATDGQLFELYNDVLQRTGVSFPSPYQTIAALEPQDLTRYDELTGLTGTDWMVSQQGLPQLLMGLGSYTIGGDNGALPAHTELYSWITTGR